MDRRNFLTTSLATSAIPFLKVNATQKDKKVKLAFIGVGLRGRNHVDQAVYREDVEITAICDIDPDAIKRTLAITQKANRKDPAVYGKTDHDFINMLKREDIDGVVIATPWEWHVPMSVESMKAGKYTAVEVSATVTLQESWDLVDTFEKTGGLCHSRMKFPSGYCRTIGVCRLVKANQIKAFG